MLTHVVKQAIFQDSDPRCAHIPDVTTFEGLMDVYSVIVVLELAELVDPQTYTKEGVRGDEHIRQINGRTDARAVRNLIWDTFEVDTSAFERCHKDKPYALDKIYWDFLIHQCFTLYTALSAFEKMKVHSTVGKPIHEEFRRRVEAHFPWDGSKVFWDNVDNHGSAPRTFAWAPFNGCKTNAAIRRRKSMWSQIADPFCRLHNLTRPGRFDQARWLHPTGPQIGPVIATRTRTKPSDEHWIGKNYSPEP
jgi:hypothetical protein